MVFREIGKITTIIGMGEFGETKNWMFNPSICFSTSRFFFKAWDFLLFFFFSDFFFTRPWKSLESPPIFWKVRWLGTLRVSTIIFRGGKIIIHVWRLTIFLKMSNPKKRIHVYVMTFTYIYYICWLPWHEHHLSLQPLSASSRFSTSLSWCNGGVEEVRTWYAWGKYHGKAIQEGAPRPVIR